MTEFDDLRDRLRGMDEMEAPDGDGEAAIAGMDEAVRVSRWLWSVTRRRAELAALAQAEIDELELRIGLVREWLADRDRPLAASAGRLSGLLESFALAERVRDKRRKSLSTPYVSVETRETSGRWVVGDEAVAWAVEHRPDLVQSTVKVPVGAARKAWVMAPGGVFDPVTGELVPGVEVEPGRVVATVKVADLPAGEAAKGRDVI